MFTMHTPPAPPVPVWIPPRGSILLPEWTHTITTIMGHPLSSESGKSIQKWILYHAIRDPIDFWLYWDPTDPYDIRLLQEYVGSNGSVVYLPSSTIKSLISLWNYMNLLINKGRSVDQKCNAQYFFQDDQWFNLTVHDMKRTLVNARMKYHRPQGQLDDINQDPTDTPSTIPTAFQAPRDDTYNPECTHKTQWKSSATNTLTLVTTQHYPNFWHTTIVRTWIPLTLQVQYHPLSKLPNIVPITLLQARLRKAIIPTLWLSHTHQILGSMLWKGLLLQQLL